ncbi:MAG: STAS domain-containing protein [Pseudomonadales bacterium]
MAVMNRRKSVLVTSEVIGNHINVLVAGELNSGTSPRVENQLRDLIDQGCEKVVVSLENVSLITSAGLRVLLVLTKDLKRQGGHIAFYDAQPNVLEIFAMTGFDSILELPPSYEAAVERVGGSIVAFRRNGPTDSLENADKPTFH